MMRLLMRVLEVVGATPLIALIALVPSIVTRLAMSTLIAPIRRAVSKRIAMAISTMIYVLKDNKLNLGITPLGSTLVSQNCACCHHRQHDKHKHHLLHNSIKLSGCTSYR